MPTPPKIRPQHYYIERRAPDFDATIKDADGVEITVDSEIERAIAGTDADPVAVKGWVHLVLADLSQWRDITPASIRAMRTELRARAEALLKLLPPEPEADRVNASLILGNAHDEADVQSNAIWLQRLRDDLDSMATRLQLTQRAPIAPRNWLPRQLATVIADARAPGEHLHGISAQGADILFRAMCAYLNTPTRQPLSYYQ